MPAKKFVLTYRVNGAKFQRRFDTYEAALARATTLEAEGIVVAWSRK